MSMSLFCVGRGRIDFLSLIRNAYDDESRLLGLLDRRMPRLPRIPIDVITTQIALGGRDKL